MTTRHIVKRDGEWGARLQKGNPVGAWCPAVVPGTEMLFASLQAALDSTTERVCPECLGLANAALEVAEVKINRQRGNVLAAAATLVRMWLGGHDGIGAIAHDDESHNDKIEDGLKSDVKNAQARLDEFRASRAGRMALDSLMPGWVYIDPSDYVPRDLWRSFVSDSKDEWLAFFLTNLDKPDRHPQVELERMIDAKFERELSERMLRERRRKYTHLAGDADA